MVSKITEVEQKMREQAGDTLGVPIAQPTEDITKEFFNKLPNVGAGLFRKTGKISIKNGGENGQNLVVDLADLVGKEHQETGSLTQESYRMEGINYSVTYNKDTRSIRTETVKYPPHCENGNDKEMYYTFQQLGEPIIEGSYFVKDGKIEMSTGKQYEIPAGELYSTATPPASLSVPDSATAVNDEVEGDDLTAKKKLNKKPLLDVNLDDLEDGGKYKLTKRSTGEEIKVTWEAKSEDGNSVVGVFRERNDDTKILYHATKTDDGKLEWKKGEPKVAPAPQPISDLEEEEKKKPERVKSEWEKDASYAAETAALVLVNGFTSSKTARGDGSVLNKSWEHDDKWANPLRDATYSAMDMLSNSSLALTTAGIALAAFTPVGLGVAVMGGLGLLMKGTRMYNEEGAVSNKLQNNSSIMDMVIVGGSTVVGVVAGAVAAPVLTATLAVTGAVLGAGYMAEKIGKVQLDKSKDKVGDLSRLGTGMAGARKATQETSKSI